MALEAVFAAPRNLEAAFVAAGGDDDDDSDGEVPQMRPTVTICNHKIQACKMHTCGFVLLLTMVLLLLLDVEYTVCHHVSISCAVADLARRFTSPDGGVVRVGMCIGNQDAQHEPDIICGPGHMSRGRDARGRDLSACCMPAACRGTVDISFGSVHDVVNLGSRELQPGESAIIPCKQWAAQPICKYR